MRWDRLFDELEGQVEHEHARARDALVEELREGEWSQVSWTDLLSEGSAVEVVVRDVGPVRGKVRFANRQVIHLTSESAEHIVATAAVAWACGGNRPAAPSAVLESLGWGHVLRSAGEDVLRLSLAGGQSVEGRLDVVGANFVRIVAGPDGPEKRPARLVPFAAIRMLTVPT
ncbi:MAG TPA: hypothetical protein VK948_05545 [Aeromicrobium sp.]|nr:hypothetical protein [Aeromicrobium sp.]